MTEPKSVQAVEDWGVVLQSVPSKNKKEIVKRLTEIFKIDRKDAEQILSNMPLILVDNISFGFAARIKKFFLTVGALVETTNHDMIKKNCFQVVWPQTPDLSFFMKHETGTAEAPAQGPKVNAKPGGFSFFEKKSEKKAMGSEIKKNQGSPLPVKSSQESAANVPPVLPIPPAPVIAPLSPPAPEAPALNPLPTFEEKPAASSSSGADLDWERRASELNEKLRKFHVEKQELHAQHAEAIEKVKIEQQQLEEERRKSDEIAKALEELHRKEAQKKEELTREGGEWRSRAEALAAKVHELEMNLTQKVDLSQRSEKVAAEAQRELSDLRDREQESSAKIERLERNVQEMSESLRSRDGMLAQFEKQIMELAERVRGYDSLRQEHAQLVQELATIHQEYDAKLHEREVLLAKVEEDHRRYRSRMDRKNAAAARELGEWIRGIDTIRQGLQKLILFFGSESAVLDGEKKSNLRSPLTRGPDVSSTGDN